jgi:hypothetical protein
MDKVINVDDFIRDYYERDMDIITIKKVDYSMGERYSQIKEAVAKRNHENYLKKKAKRAARIMEANNE